MNTGKLEAAIDHLRYTLMEELGPSKEPHLVEIALSKKAFDAIIFAYNGVPNDSSNSDTSGSENVYMFYLKKIRFLPKIPYRPSFDWRNAQETE